MKTIVVDLAKQMPQDRPLHVTLSFERFIDYLSQQTIHESGLSRKILALVLEQLAKNPAFAGTMSLETVKGFEEQLQLVYGLLVPALQQKELIWGLSSPLLPVIFYSTDLLYDILLSVQYPGPGHAITENNHKVQLERIYRFILERLYGFAAIEQNDMVVSVKVKETPLTKYYQIHIDSRFAEVTAKGRLPSISQQDIELLTGNGMNVDSLSRILPIETFDFKGFSVITATDVTQKHALEILKSIVLNRNAIEKDAYFEQINATLRDIVCDQNLEFGLMPFLKINDKLVFNYNVLESSRLIRAAKRIDIAETAYLNLANNYIADPKRFVTDVMANSTMEDELKTALSQQAIHSLAILPVYHDGVLCGVLEVYSKAENGIATSLLKKLELAMELLGRAYEYIISEFETEINSIILEKFTSLQPAVSWKFKNAGWNYLRNKAGNFSKTDNYLIEFRDVYPLYGAIDIRGSTLERNRAVHQDLRAVLNVLIEILSSLKNSENLQQSEGLLYTAKQILTKLDDHLSDEYELEIKHFLDNQIDPFFSQLIVADKNKAASIENESAYESVKQYYNFTDSQTGEAYAQRRGLEASIRLINDAVGQQLDVFSKKTQETYPAYFEKFRTDGVEYNIYTGQSISPELPFSMASLSSIRFGQLQSMAYIACHTNSLLTGMPVKLQTTQLMLVNPGSINITFRSDERRFDVEGAYNIRYQVIKKRIDKVHILGTSHRLTQPGKIAIVYFDLPSAEEYVGYITCLQQQGLLCEDLEFLDLEHLQGVTGLKAIRVGVRYGQQNTVNVHPEYNCPCNENNKI